MWIISQNNIDPERPDDDVTREPVCEMMITLYLGAGKEVINQTLLLDLPKAQFPLLKEMQHAVMKE